MADRSTVGLLLGGLGAGVFGCGEEPPPNPFETGAASSSSTAGSASADGSGTAGPDDSASATGTGSASASGTTQSTADEGSDDVLFDVGGGADVPTVDCVENPDAPECENCTAVDILFVVDNSGSMQSHAPGVTAAFDDFVDAMVNALPPATSLHVGLTRGTGFFDPGNSGGFNGGTCEGFTDGVWNPPDTGMETGTNGHQGRLFEHDGQRYFDYVTGQDPASLNTWFGGALTGVIDPFVGYSNSETVVAGAAYAFHPANDAYNMGFMREQAVLVIFLLSDSPDLSPDFVPTSDFIDIVSDAKAGCGDMCILTTGAISAGCYDTPGIANTRLYDFMNGFGQPPVTYTELPINGPTPDLGMVLGDTLSEVVAEVCGNIPPAG